MAEDNPSQADGVFSILAKIAKGIGDAFNVPEYLGWGLILVISLTIIYILLIAVEGFIRILRYIVLAFWAIVLVGFAIAFRFA